MSRGDSFDTIVVGGGVIGCSVFYQLAKTRNSRVLLIEGERVGMSGATRDTGAIVRAFDPDPRIMELAQRSLDDYREFERRIGSSNPFQERRLLYNVGATVDQVRQHLGRYAEPRFELAIRGPDELAELAGFPSDSVLVEDRHAGFLDPLRTCRGYVESAVGHGGQVVEGTPVISLAGRAGCCEEVVTTRARYRASRVVIASGAQGQSLNRTSFESLQLRSKLIRYVIADAELARTAMSARDEARLPILLDDVSGYYMKPISESSMLLGRVVDRWDLDLGALPPFEEAEVQRLLAHFRLRIPGLSRLEARSTVTGYDLYTPARIGELRFSDRLRNCLLVTGWSGHGFKIAPEIGRLASRKVQER